MPPRPKKPSTKLTNKLLEAINFFSFLKEEGAPCDTHILLANKTITASNGTTSAGVIIDEDLYAAPNALVFRKALSKCGNEYTLSIDGTRIIVKSGGFKAVVPCIDPALLANPFPDNSQAPINNDLKIAMGYADLVKVENGQRVELLSFLLNGPSIISTDGKIIIEYWHGINLPTNIAIPKSIISSIVGNSKKLIGFGFSPNSCTFWFDDNSWIKSQLYAQPWPTEACLSVLNKPSHPLPIMPDFFKALDAITPFSSGTVWFEQDMLCSHRTTEAGATHEVKGLPRGPVYTAKYLSIIKSFAEQVDFTVNSGSEFNGYLCYFFGKNVRGVIAGHG